MKHLKQILLIGLLLPLIVLTGACNNPNTPPASTGDPEIHVSLWVTRDFGAETIFCSELVISSGQTVLDLLQEHLEVGTGYGGGFVNSINGLESGHSEKAGEKQMLDWFFYVNGILSGQGAADYVAAAGDIIWWDYHPWGNISLTPAVVGAFPQPFTGGYKGKNPGTLILAAEACGEPAEKLARFLKEQGADPVKVAPYREREAMNRSQMVIVVAPWEQLCQSPFWEGIQQYRDRTGWFAELTPGRFYPLDLYARRLGEGYSEKVGAVLATGSGLGDPHPLWLVTGTDMEGLAGAVTALVSRPEQFAQSVGALIIDGEASGLPGAAGSVK